MTRTNREVYQVFLCLGRTERRVVRSSSLVRRKALQVPQDCAVKRPNLGAVREEQSTHPSLPQPAPSWGLRRRCKIDPGRTRTYNPRLRGPMPYPLGHRTSDVFLTPPASKSAPCWFLVYMRQSTCTKPLSFSAAVRLMLLKGGLPCQTQEKLACSACAVLPRLREKQEQVCPKVQAGRLLEARSLTV